MKQDDKELLLRDLCGRLPYEVKVQYEDNIFTIDYISAMYEEIKLNTPNRYTIDVLEVKPYLFPLSSMTEEQKDYIRNRFCYEWESDEEVSDLWKHKLEFGDALEFIQWCCENHLDINSLIPKGLAIDATDKNIY